MAEQLAIDGGTPVRTGPYEGINYDFGDDDLDAVTQVIRDARVSGSIGKGPKVDAFEEAFAARHGMKYAVSVNSGTSAFHTIFGAINPDPGDEIICTPWTAGGSITGAVFQNCIPVWADVDETYTLDPADVEAKITSKTRAIVAVHLMGNVCDMGALRDIARRHQIYLIEDCCQAHFSEYQGQLVGTMGDAGGFAFGNGKHMTGGVGGIVITDNESLWERAKIFADCGLPRANGPYEGRPYSHQFLAPNFKINDLTAAVLLVQLGKADGYVENKRRNAHNIIEALSDVEELAPQKVRPGDRHTYWLLGFTIDTDTLGCTASEFAAAVTAEGAPMSGPYTQTDTVGPLYRNPLFAQHNAYGSSHMPFDIGRDRPVDYRLVECPKGEALMSRNVNISTSPNYTEEEVGEIIHAIRKVTTGMRERVSKPKA